MSKNQLIINVFAHFNEWPFFLHLESNNTFSRCRPISWILPSFIHSFFLFFAVELTFEVNFLQFFPITVLLGQNGKPDQNKINWLEFASQVSPMPPLIQSALTLLPSPHTFPHLFQTPLIPQRCLYLHIFIYPLLHSWFSPNNPLHWRPSLLPHPSLHHPPHYPLISWNLFATSRCAARPTFTRFITPPHWVWSKANWIPVKYLYFSLVCLI